MKKTNKSYVDEEHERSVQARRRIVFTQVQGTKQTKEPKED